MVCSDGGRAAGEVFDCVAGIDVVLGIEWVCAAQFIKGRDSESVTTAIWVLGTGHSVGSYRAGSQLGSLAILLNVEASLC